MRATHVAVQEVASCAVGIGMRCENLITSGRRANTEGIGEVACLRLRIRAIAPTDGQVTVVIEQRRRSRCCRCHIGRSVRHREQTCLS